MTSLKQLKTDSHAFSYTVIRNCRKFYKRYYTLSSPADDALVDQLERFGLKEVVAFSQYAATSLDIFTIKFEQEIEISGAFKSNQVQVTISKQYPEFLHEFEEILDNWYKSK